MGSFESAPPIINRERGQHDAERNRTVTRSGHDRASHDSRAGQHKKNSREWVPRRTIDPSGCSNLAAAQNEKRCRCHPEENEVDSNCKVQNLAICPRTGDDDCRYTLKDDGDYRRSRSPREFTDASKKKTVA